jgi:hypothetical protein
MRTLSYAVILSAMCFPLDAYAAGNERFIPDCAGVVKIAHADVARVERDGTLILSDGRALWLEGLRLPSAGARPQAVAALRALVAGPVNFTTVTPGKDRYGRLRVQGIGRVWIQTALLEQGLAQVLTAPDRAECAPDLYEAEARARDAHRGIWASPDYRVRAPSAVTDNAGTFQLVEGQVGHIGRSDGRTFIDFDGFAGRGAQLSLVVGPSDRHAFRDFDFDELPGRHIRIRGIVQSYRGRPEIALSNPFQIEILN